MSDAIIVALITGACAVIAQLIISHQTSKQLFAELKNQSELSDAKLEAKLDKVQAVTDTKIEELTREVRIHNGFAQRVPVLEEKVKHLEQHKGGN